MVVSVCVPLRPLPVFHTVYIAGFIFPSLWWCLRSFLALTCHNLNSASLPLTASNCVPHRSLSVYSTYCTWAIHSCHTAKVPLFCHHPSTRQGDPPVFPPALCSDHHKCPLNWTLTPCLTIPNTESSSLLSDSLKLKATASMNCHGLAKSTWQYHSIPSESSFCFQTP